MTLPDVWVFRRHVNGLLSWKVLIMFSSLLLNHLRGPSSTGECSKALPEHEMDSRHLQWKKKGKKKKKITVIPLKIQG